MTIAKILSFMFICALAPGIGSLWAQTGPSSEKGSTGAERSEAGPLGTAPQGPSVTGPAQPSGPAMQGQGKSPAEQRGDTAADTTVGAQLSSEEIKRVQQSLKVAGCDPGQVNGEMGAQTREALQCFQKSKGLQPTGQLDSQTAQALGIEKREPLIPEGGIKPRQQGMRPAPGATRQERGSPTAQPPGARP